MILLLMFGASESIQLTDQQERLFTNLQAALRRNNEPQFVDSENLKAVRTHLDAKVRTGDENTLLQKIEKFYQGLNTTTTTSTTFFRQEEAPIPNAVTDSEDDVRAPDAQYTDHVGGVEVDLKNRALATGVSEEDYTAIAQTASSEDLIQFVQTQEKEHMEKVQTLVCAAAYFANHLVQEGYQTLEAYLATLNTTPPQPTTASNEDLCAFLGITLEEATAEANIFGVSIEEYLQSQIEGQKEALNPA